jgi:hypothetical protein
MWHIKQHTIVHKCDNPNNIPLHNFGSFIKHYTCIPWSLNQNINGGGISKFSCILSKLHSCQNNKTQFTLSSEANINTYGNLFNFILLFFLLKYQSSQVVMKRYSIFSYKSNVLLLKHWCTKMKIIMQIWEQWVRTTRSTCKVK